MATPLWLTGFEHGAGATGANGVFDTFSAGASIVTSPARTGSRALQIAASASAPQCGYTIGAGSRVVTQSFYVRFATLPTADVQLAHFVGAVNAYVWFMNTNDSFAVSVTTSGQVEGGPTVVVDTWYRIDVEYDTSTGTALISCKVDGGTEFTDSQAQAAADITAGRLGPTSSATYTGFFDDWVISVTDGDYPIGAHKIESLIPSSDGTHNITTSGDFDSFTGTAFSNSTTNGNTFIGHRPMQRANTADQVIRQELGTTANYMEFGLENLSDNTLAIMGVRAYACHVEAAASGASLGAARLLLSDNTEVLTTGSISVIDSTEDPGTTVSTKKRMTIAPSGGWDGTKVDGLKARVGFADNAPDVNFIDFMLEVALVEVAAQQVDGVALSATPSLPAGSLRHSLTGVVLTVTPSLPTGSVSAGGQQVDGVALSATPTLPAGSLRHSLTGVALSATPTLPAGSLRHSVTGVTLSATPTLPAGALRVALTGVTISATPTLPAGALRHTVTGVALTATPSLPAGQVTIPGAQTVTGVALSATPSLPAGALTHTVTGTVLVVAPSLPAGALAVPQTVGGVVLVLTPTLPVGTATKETLGLPVPGPTRVLVGGPNAAEGQGPNQAVVGAGRNQA